MSKMQRSKRNSGNLPSVSGKQNDPNTFFVDVFKERLVYRHDSPHICGSISKRNGKRIVQVRKFNNGEATKQGFSTTLEIFKQLPFASKPLPAIHVIEEQLLVTPQACRVIIASLGRDENRGVTGLWLTKKEWGHLQGFVEPLTQAFKITCEDGEESFEDMSAEEDEEDETSLIEKARVPALLRQPAKRKTVTSPAKPRAGKKPRTTEEPLEDSDTNYIQGSQLEPLYLD